MVSENTLTFKKINFENKEELTSKLITEICEIDDYNHVIPNEYANRNLLKLENPNFNIYLIYSGKILVGSAEVDIFPRNKAYLYKLFVKKEIQRKGFGTLLFYYLLQDLGNNHQTKEITIIPQSGTKEIIRKIVGKRAIVINIKTELQKLDVLFKTKFKYKLRTQNINCVSIDEDNIKQIKDTIYLLPKAESSQSKLFKRNKAK